MSGIPRVRLGEVHHVDEEGEVQPRHREGDLLLVLRSGHARQNGTASPAAAAPLRTVRRVVRRSVTSEIVFDTPLLLSMSTNRPRTSGACPMANGVVAGIFPGVSDAAFTTCPHTR